MNSFICVIQENAGAIIGVVGTIVGAIIGGIISYYSTLKRFHLTLEKEKKQEQEKIKFNRLMLGTYIAVAQYYVEKAKKDLPILDNKDWPYYIKNAIIDKDWKVYIVNSKLTATDTIILVDWFKRVDYLVNYICYGSNHDINTLIIQCNKLLTDQEFLRCIADNDLKKKE